MDDVLVPETDGSSPYPFTRVKEIIGRQEETLVFTNEHGHDDFIHPIVVVEFVVPGLNAWQVGLQTKTSFCFRARLDPGLDAAERDAVCANIHDKLDALLAEKEMRNVQFTIETVETLPIDPHSGKFRLVVREKASASPAFADLEHTALR